MIGPILFAIGACLCGGAMESDSSSSTRARKVPPRGGTDAFDDALCHALRSGYTTEQAIAYVLKRLHPGRAATPELARSVRDSIRARLGSPGFLARCRGARG